MIRVAVIGTGGWGKNHLRVLSELGCLTTFCDIDEQRVVLYEGKYHVKGYLSVDELLSKEIVDAVTICSPTGTHGKIAKKTLETGIHTFIEKPLTSTSIEGDALVELAEQSKLILTSGYIERFNPAVSDLKELIRSKRIGVPFLLEFHRENKWAGNIKDVGIVTDTSVHDIDTARWLFEAEPKVVFARTGRVISEHEDFATIMLGFDSQKTAFITSNWVTPKRVRRLATVCSAGIATIDFITQELQIDDEQGTTVPRRAWKEPLLLELKSFVECVEKHQQPLLTGRDAVNTTKIAEAALVSSNTGAPIYLEL